ncbi:MAG: hypothetical protein HYU66_10410 [Armatimonadetes bacterium]|nr:hypothetical protein [Armatimonadota bacterium]
MRSPVMQQEWQRRQSQRHVWMLLGLFAVVAAAAATPPSALPQPGRSPAPVGAAAAVSAPAAGPAAGRSRGSVSARYWRDLAPAHDRRVRVALQHHAAVRPAVPAARAFLARFVRPPTRD